LPFFPGEILVETEVARIKNNCNKKISKGQYDGGHRKEDKAQKLDKKWRQYFLAAFNQ